MTMTDESQPRDPFKPEQPRIPGVPFAQEHAGKTAEFSTSLMSKLSRVETPPKWLTMTILAAVVAGVAVAWLTR
jgi:hypothetical protein